MSSADLASLAHVEPSANKPLVSAEDNQQPDVAASADLLLTTADDQLANGDLGDLEDGLGSHHSLDEEFETLSLSGDNELDLYTCSSCHEEFKQPRVLSCLHVYCEDCLKPKLIEDCITCPACKLTTEVESVRELPLDYVIANSLDMKGIQGCNMTCTSCKAKEKAVARCSDCANFLCPNCVTAHQFMRCFENHKVVTFDDITKEEGMAIHRPITCSLHGEEQPMKYFCNTCQILICNECMMTDHRQPGHQVERVGDIENREITYMKSLIAEAQQKIGQCEEKSNNLQQSLTELESQRDDAKSLIKETFQSYKAMIEKRQESLLSQLEQLHERQELSVMEMFHQIGNTVEKIERGSDFVSRIVEKSNSLELLSLKKTMNQYMLTQMNKSLGGNISVDIEFVTDNKKFEASVEDHFGHFKLRDESVIRNQQAHQQMQQIRKLERETSRNNIASQVTQAGDHGFVSMQSPGGYTQHSDMSVNLGGSMNSGNMHSVMSAPMLGSPDSGLCTDTMRPILSHDFTGSAFQMPPTNGATPTLSDQLGLRNAVVGGGVDTNIQPRSQSRQSQSPTISDSGIGMDSNSPGAHHIPSSPPFNLAALAKHGTVTLSPQGQVLLNNQPIPGMNVSNVTGFNHAMPTGGNLAVSNASSPDQELQMSHGSGMFSPPIVSSAGYRGGQGNTIESVLSQRRESTMSSLGTGGPQSNMSMPPGGGGGSGFTSPTPGQQPPSSNQFPLRSKMSAMQIRAKFGQLGPSKGQFNSPHGFCMGIDEDVVVADTNNHRIQVFDKSGDFKYQFGIPGREEGQLWYPRKVAVMRGTGRYVICDRGNERSRMQIFTKNGHFVKKIAIRYIDIVAGLAITQQGNIVAVDSVSPTVFTISEGGDLIKWFDCSDYMREPSDIAVADKEYFVCDFKGHCVVVFNDDGQFQRRIGTDSITNFPNGIDISDAGDILVGDSHGNRFHVAVFQRDGSLIGEFECPYVKVSRCCGLKITSEGYVVTLAKNNHHVLVLNTLYIS